MESTCESLKLHTWARHRTQLFQDAIWKGHIFTQGIIYTYSRVRDRTTVDHTGKAAALDPFPTVSTL